MPSQLYPGTQQAVIQVFLMEFQAVIMAGGRGSRMTDLTASVPKALLPVGNKPLVWYPVNMLEKAGFESVIIITVDSVKHDLIQALQLVGELQIHLDVVTIPSDEDWGTAESLRYIQDKIKTDVLVVSCDLITDMDLQLLADVHRTYDASVTVLMHTAPDQSTEGAVPGTKSKRKQDQRDIIGLDEKGQRILLLAAEADIEEALTVRKSVLKRYPFIQVKTRLLDAHMYILKKWVMDFLVDNKIGSSYSTIKGELIPYLVRKQFSRPKMSLMNSQPDSIEPERPQEDKDTDISSYGGVDELTRTARAMSSWNEHMGEMSDYFQHEDMLRCHTYVMDGGFCIRANTMAAYCEANRQITQQKHVLGDELLIPPTATIKSKSQVGQESMLGDGTMVGERVSIKRSIIGKHCTVGDKVKIINSVIMDYVKISDGCVIQGSVICGHAHIGESVEMKDCLVGSSQNVVPKVKYSCEVIGDTNRMMEI